VAAERAAVQIRQNAISAVPGARIVREFLSVRTRVARRLDARLRFVRFALGAARIAIVVALVGEAFSVAVLIRVILRNW
jgi:hypothetical protein